MLVQQREHRGLLTFFIVWLGQLVSIIGSNLTGFAVGVWVYQRTGSVTSFGLIAFFTLLPNIIISPIAGVLADRWDRRWIMILGDSGAALSTLTIALLFFTEQLDIWHIYLITATSAACSALQLPAYLTLTTLLVPKQHFGRVSGLTQLGDGIAQIIAPGLAGLLIVTIGFSGVILIDVLTFAFSIVTLLIVRFPKTPPSTQELAGPAPFIRDTLSGWSYIVARPGLTGLLMFMLVIIFSLGLVQVLLTPLVLSFSTTDVLGLVLTTVGMGLLVGSLIMSVWGGPSVPIYGILGFALLQGLVLLLGGLQPSPFLVAGAAFVFTFSLPLVMGCNQIIWQRNVPVAIQGRVFAARQAVSGIAAPLAYLVAGPLATYVFEPALAPNGRLAASVGQLIGTGPGRGIALFLIVAGCLIMLAVLGAAIYPPIREIEAQRPDPAVEQAFASEP